jgi:hypothetical protein
MTDIFIIVKNDGFHSYNTRHKYKIAIMTHKSSFREKSQHFHTDIIYDFLPNRLIENIENYIIFKNQNKQLWYLKNITPE